MNFNKEVYDKTINDTKKYIVTMNYYKSKRQNKYLYHSINELILLLEFAIKNLENKLK